MRGYKVVWTDLGALWYNLTYCGDMEGKYVVSWPVVGQFKARGGVADCYMILIAGTTRSEIRFVEWTQRFVVRLAHAGLTEGWAFRKQNGTRAKDVDYKDNIFTNLEKIQQSMN